MTSCIPSFGISSVDKLIVGWLKSPKTILVKPLLHFHVFGPGLLRFETVVTPSKFGPGSTLSTVLLRCSYGARGRSTEDLRVRPRIC